LGNDNKFEKMMTKFLKNSKDKNREATKEHTKSDDKKSKADKAKRRRINEKKRSW